MSKGMALSFLKQRPADVLSSPDDQEGVEDAVVDGVTGLLVDPLNIDLVASETVRLLTDETLAKRLGDQGRERVIREVTWEATTRVIEKVFEEILETAE